MPVLPNVRLFPCDIANEQNDSITHPDSHSKEGVRKLESHDSGGGEEDWKNCCTPVGVEVIQMGQHTSPNEKNFTDRE